jgi:hypothetical protein
MAEKVGMTELVKFDMRPDVEKLHSLGAQLRDITLPALKTKAARAFMDGISAELYETAGRCAAFGTTKEKA